MKDYGKASIGIVVKEGPLPTLSPPPPTRTQPPAKSSSKFNYFKGLSRDASRESRLEIGLGGGLGSGLGGSLWVSPLWAPGAILGGKARPACLTATVAPVLLRGAHKLGCVVGILVSWRENGPATQSTHKKDYVLAPFKEGNIKSCQIKSCQFSNQFLKKSPKVANMHSFNLDFYLVKTWHKIHYFVFIFIFCYSLASGIFKLALMKGLKESLGLFSVFDFYTMLALKGKHVLILT